MLAAETAETLEERARLDAAIRDLEGALKLFGKQRVASAARTKKAPKPRADKGAHVDFAAPVEIPQGGNSAVNAPVFTAVESVSLVSSMPVTPRGDLRRSLSGHSPSYSSGSASTPASADRPRHDEASHYSSPATSTGSQSPDYAAFPRATPTRQPIRRSRKNNGLLEPNAEGDL